MCKINKVRQGKKVKPNNITLTLDTFAVEAISRIARKTYTQELVVDDTASCVLAAVMQISRVA